MKIIRYLQSDRVYYGVLGNDGAIERIDGSPFDGIHRTGERDDITSVKILSPVERPRIFGVAYNYKAHTDETGKEQPSIPVLFMKPGTAAIGQDDAVLYPDGAEIVHYEGELVVVIGKLARHLPVESALDCVLGYCCGNDISDRVVQRQESKFGCLLAGKGYDTFAPLGPAIVTDLDPTNLQVITRQNGVVRQSGNTRDLVFTVAEIISYLSRFMTLLPGDVIMTGTPAGVGPIAVGDQLEVEIPGIGTLRNPVASENAIAEAV
jgi:2-keto-4-pentenoate hydratase/2-oxohepta-3-ene-1,7-dioic acid hydratase in catechol pathway